MGIYTIKCPGCKEPTLWFSGSMDQRCDDCKAKDNKMDSSQSTLDNLHKIISLQAEIITLLKADIERLKAVPLASNTQTVNIPITPTQQPPWPLAPQPYGPINPNPYVVTCTSDRLNETGQQTTFTGTTSIGDPTGTPAGNSNYTTTFYDQDGKAIPIKIG